MESLASIQRCGGVRFYCFSEAKLKLFSSVPEGTLKSWVRFLEIQRVKPSTAKHGFLHRTSPGYALAAFHLISEHDLVRLLEHSDRTRVMASTGETQSFPPTQVLAQSEPISRNFPTNAFGRCPNSSGYLCAAAHVPSTVKPNPIVLDEDKDLASRSLTEHLQHH